MNADWVLAIATSILAFATIILAIATIYLVSEAKKQLSKAKEFVSSYTSTTEKLSKFNQVLFAQNLIAKQIDFHYKIVERIEADPQNSFLTLYETLKGHYGFTENNLKEKDRIYAAYDQLYQEYGSLLGHYYRNLYRIWKKINETEIDGFDKKYFAKLVRAQLSENEILLLFYNCLWIKEYDKGNFKKLIETYELLEGINYDRLLKRDHYENLYLENAFGTDIV